jgi:hypothetical protein
MAEEQLLKHAVKCDDEKDLKGNSIPMISVEDGQDLDFLPPPPKKLINKIA